MTNGSAGSPIARKLERTSRLSDEERTAIERLPMHALDFAAKQDIVRAGDRPSRCFAILEGFACQTKMTGGGCRQIAAIHIPGDIPDLQSLHLTVLDSTITTLTSCRIGFIRHEIARDLCDRFPGIAGALWRETLIEAASYREWVLNVGQRPAYARIAHVFCEIFERMRAINLTRGYVCAMPMTQSDLADGTGLTVVHVNRTLKELRLNRLLRVCRRDFEILDWEELQAVADYDPAYLHMETGPEAA